MKKTRQLDLFDDEMNLKYFKIVLKDIDFQSSDFWEYCDNCGEKLISRKCELICIKCGFFHSCSEP